MIYIVIGIIYVATKSSSSNTKRAASGRSSGWSGILDGERSVSKGVSDHLPELVLSCKVLVRSLNGLPELLNLIVETSNDLLGKEQNRIFSMQRDLDTATSELQKLQEKSGEPLRSPDELALVL